MRETGHTGDRGCGVLVKAGHSCSCSRKVENMSDIDRFLLRADMGPLKVRTDHIAL